MDSKQKERLQILLKARKRADKVLAQRREAERQKLDHDQRLKANQELIQQYTQELNDLARESGILALAEQAAQTRRGSLTQELSCYLHYGLSSSSFPNAMAVARQGDLRAGHLALLITWRESGASYEAEIRVHKKGLITFHNSFLPVFPFIWRRYPHLLQKMLDSAMQHPRHASIRKKKGARF